MTIVVTGLQELRADLQGFSQRRVRAAMATGLTRAAKRLGTQWQEQIDTRISAPTLRTQKATVFTGATAATLESVVKLKDRMQGVSPSEYLAPQETGGGRRAKKFEQALVSSGAMPAGYVTVPGRAAKLDSYGNVSRAQIVAVISQIGSNYSPGYARVISKSTAKRLEAQARRGRAYVVVRPEDAARANASAGIYERTATGARRAIFLFVRSVTYRKRLGLLEDADRRAGAVLEAEVDRAVAESAQRLLDRGAR